MDQQSAYGIMLAKIRAHRQTTEVITRGLEPFGVTVNEWLLMGAIKKHGSDVSSSELARELSVSMPLISRLTRQLEAKKLLTMVKTKEDKRGRDISLSSNGEQLLQEAEPAVRTALKQWLSPIDREHVNTYIAVLMQVAYKL